MLLNNSSSVIRGGTENYTKSPYQAILKFMIALNTFNVQVDCLYHIVFSLPFFSEKTIFSILSPIHC